MSHTEDAHDVAMAAGAAEITDHPATTQAEDSSDVAMTAGAGDNADQPKTIPFSKSPEAAAWLYDSDQVKKVKDTKMQAVALARSIYGNDRNRFFDVLVCPFDNCDDDRKFGAHLIYTLDGVSKILRQERGPSALNTVQKMAEGLQRDVSTLFSKVGSNAYKPLPVRLNKPTAKYAPGNTFEGQQGLQNEIGEFELLDHKIYEPVGAIDDTRGMGRTYSSQGYGDSGRGRGRGRGRGGHDNGGGNKRARFSYDNE